MKKQRIYIDTSVIGGCFDIEFEKWSNLLFDEFISGNFIAVVSLTSFDELQKAPEKVKNRLKDIPDEFLEILEINNDVKVLAKKYIELDAISEKHFDDATHIAYSSYYNVDVLVSWNFKHIVNAFRINRYNAINLMNGYKVIDIRSPREVLNEEE